MSAPSSSRHSDDKRVPDMDEGIYKFQAKLCGRFSFLDDKNVVRGPYGEEQLQEWYRRGFFHSKHKFYPQGESEAISLGDLISLTGPEMPFRIPQPCIDLHRERRRLAEAWDSYDLRLEELNIRERNLVKREKKMKKEKEELDCRSQAVVSLQIQCDKKIEEMEKEKLRLEYMRRESDPQWAKVDDERRYGDLSRRDSYSEHSDYTYDNKTEIMKYE